MKIAAKALILTALPMLTLTACVGDELYGSDVYVIHRRPVAQVVVDQPQYARRVVVVQPNTPPPAVTLRRAPAPVMAFRPAPGPVVAVAPVFGFHHHHHHGFGQVVVPGPAPVVSVQPAPVVVGRPAPVIDVRPPVVVGGAPAPVVVGQARTRPAPVIARALTNHGPVTITTRNHAPQIGGTDDAERTEKPKTIIVGQG